MANLIVSGAGGRMGRLLVSMIARDQQHKLAGALEARAAGFGGQDAGELAGVGRLGIAITDDYASIARPDTVTLDFTSAAASLEHLEVASAKGAAIVVGSTGFTAEMEAAREATGGSNPYRDRAQHEHRHQRADENHGRGRKDPRKLRRRGAGDPSSHQGRCAQRNRARARPHDR